MKKAKRKAAREAKLASRETPPDAVSAASAPDPDPTPTSTPARRQTPAQAPNPYVVTGQGTVRRTDQLVHRATGRVLCTLDDIPSMRRLIALRDRQAERQYGIPSAQ